MNVSSLKQCNWQLWITLAYCHETCLLGKPKLVTQKSATASWKLPKFPSANFKAKWPIFQFLDPNHHSIFGRSWGFGDISLWPFKLRVWEKHQASKRKNHEGNQISCGSRRTLSLSLPVAKETVTFFSFFRGMKHPMWWLPNWPRGHGISAMLMPLFCKPHYNKKTGRFSRKRGVVLQFKSILLACSNAIRSVFNTPMIGSCSPKTHCRKMVGKEILLATTSFPVLPQMVPKCITNPFRDFSNQWPLFRV